jgi:hypothetical protein
MSTYSLLLGYSSPAKFTIIGKNLSLRACTSMFPDRIKPISQAYSIQLVRAPPPRAHDISDLQAQNTRGTVKFYVP